MEQEDENIRVSGCLCFKILGITGCPNTRVRRVSVYQSIRISGYLHFRYSGNQDIRILRHMGRIKISGVNNKVISHKYSDDDQQDGICEVGSSQASASLL